MFLLSILAFSLFSHLTASSVPESLDSGTDWSTDVPVLGPVSRLRVTNHFIAPDGHNRSAILVNGKFPGPLIQANKNDRFSIKLVNELTDDAMLLETAIHYHGLFQRDSNWADGAAWVTQCPVRPQETFVQKFKATGQTGTYWYHSHYAAQRCSGLQGAMVIYDPEDPLGHLYDVDGENTVITLSDWYHSPYVPRKIFGFPNATLINGKGRYAGGPPVPLSVTEVQQGVRYRFRVVAMSCEATFNFTIDGHRMTIIEVDGNEVSPVETDSIRIHPGQRYSVVISADQPVGNYWIRALTNLPNATFDGGQNMAIFRYDGAAVEDPTSPPGPYELSFDEGALHPLIKPGAPGTPEIGKADVNIALVPGFKDGNFTLNNVSFVNPSVPLLLQILGGTRQATKLLPDGSVYTLPPNKVIEVSFPNPAVAGAPHPLHLHGNAFDVVRVAGSNKTNFIDPVRRDVVSIGTDPMDNVTVRFVTDNPGPWIFHCHIDHHFEHGFAVVMAVAPNETAYEESKVVPEDWRELCKRKD